MDFNVFVPPGTTIGAFTCFWLALRTFGNISGVKVTGCRKLFTMYLCLLSRAGDPAFKRLRAPAAVSLCGILVLFFFFFKLQPQYKEHRKALISSTCGECSVSTFQSFNLFISICSRGKSILKSLWTALASMLSNHGSCRMYMLPNKTGYHYLSGAYITGQVIIHHYERSKTTFCIYLKL